MEAKMIFWAWFHLLLPPNSGEENKKINRKKKKEYLALSQVGHRHMPRKVKFQTR